MNTKIKSCLAALLMTSSLCAFSATPYTTININQASIQQLTKLKGIGQSKAQAIVTYRNKHGAFKSLEAITAVKGIGPKLLMNDKKMMRLK